MQHRQCIGL